MPLLTYKIEKPTHNRSHHELTLYEGAAVIHRAEFKLPNWGPVDLMNWFVALTPLMRNFWVARAGSAEPADAYHAFLENSVLKQAEQIGTDWALSQNGRQHD